ncbi:MAG TPA: inorganic diphosphatase [Patescibacteria group bacterium]|nr:inorganic diphosphatase [Patescibacteria group bacterium]
MNVKNLPFGTLDEFNVFVEIPKHSHNKYEYDEALDIIKLDRVLFGSQVYPGNYGFIPQTRALDGDHADALVLSTNPVPSGVVISCRALGIMHMVDHGEVDNKIIAVAIKDPRFEDIHTLQDLPKHTLDEIKNFFETYKILEKKDVEISVFEGVAEAKTELEKTHQAYLNE